MPLLFCAKECVIVSNALIKSPLIWYAYTLNALMCMKEQTNFNISLLVQSTILVICVALEC